MAPSIPVGFIADALQGAECRGWDVRSVLGEHGLSQASLWHPESLVSVDRYSAVLRSLRRLSNDAFFGFLSQPVPPKAFAFFCYGLVGCRTFDECIAHANEYYRLFTHDLHWRLQRDADSLRVVVTIKRALDADYRFVIQSVLLMTLRLFSWLLGADIKPLSVDFSFARCERDERLRYLFGDRVRFACREDAIQIAGIHDQARLSCTRDQITQMLRGTRHLFLVSRPAKPLSQQIRAQLLLRRAAGWASAREIAESLGMTPSQLWRRLRREDCSFLALRDEIKRDLAIALLEEPDHTVEAIADALHYADVSAFRKAFKKWTGMQPSLYRSQLYEKGNALP